MKLETIACRENKDIITDSKASVCINCGLIDKYNITSECIDYHESRHCIIKKSLYHRKYHFRNLINKICDTNDLYISTCNLIKIKSDF